ncbi:MAG: chromate transporter [Bacteroidales bacterium]|nr:chromate transporter [Bacteroidales bacterium]
MSDYLMLILQLFWSFFFIGIFTFGGGYAIMSLIQSEIVMARGWLSEATFTDIAAISQMTPGPIGLNCSTYTGYAVLRNAGADVALSTLGSAAASLAVVLPSFIMMTLIVHFYARAHETPVFQRVLSALKPVVAGLIGAAALGLMVRIQWGGGAASFQVLEENFASWKSWVLFALSATATLHFKNATVKILLAGALAGLIGFA